MNKLDINEFYLVASFLKSREISTFGNVSNYVYRGGCRLVACILFNMYNARVWIYL